MGEYAFIRAYIYTHIYIYIYVYTSSGIKRECACACIDEILICMLRRVYACMHAWCMGLCICKVLQRWTHWVRHSYVHSTAVDRWTKQQGIREEAVVIPGRLHLRSLTVRNVPATASYSCNMCVYITARPNTRVMCCVYADVCGGTYVHRGV